MKRNNHESEAGAEAGVLGQFDRLRAILAATHYEIPQLLARERSISRGLGLNETEELRAQLADITQQRQVAVRRRSASIAAISELAPALQAEREAMERQRQEYAVEAVAAFQVRYAAAVGALQGLWAEGKLLSETLKVQVPMALPTKVVTSVVDGVARAQPVLADVQVTVDVQAAQLGGQIDRVDGALSLCNAIRQSHQFDTRAYHLALQRGAPTERGGVYRVMIEFDSLTDGLPFHPGDLVDGSLIGQGQLLRLTAGRRYVQPVELGAAA